jgi:outer membrane receptor for ferric coprogen and ferric-rhodotorulic acid
MANPWKADEWNLTEQGRYIKRYGVDAGARLAQSVGSSLGAPKPVIAVINKIYVVQGKKGDKGDQGEPGAVIPLVIDGD